MMQSIRSRVAWKLNNLPQAPRRWKFRFIVWFFNKPDQLDRSVHVEGVLMQHAKNGTSPSSEECRQLALNLGIPTRFQMRDWD
jgi:hypothetical protein